MSIVAATVVVAAAIAVSPPRRRRLVPLRLSLPLLLLWLVVRPSLRLLLRRQLGGRAKDNVDGRGIGACEEASAHLVVARRILAEALQPEVVDEAVVRQRGEGGLDALLAPAHAAQQDAEAVAAELTQAQLPLRWAHVRDGAVGVEAVRGAHRCGGHATYCELLCGDSAVVLEAGEAKAAHGHAELRGERGDGAERVHLLLA